MRPVPLLRAASLVALLQATAHTTLFLRARATGGAVAVVDAMQGYRFDVQGFSRSYWDFYWGYGLMSAFVVFVEALLFWQLARTVHRGPESVRAVALVFVAYNLGHAALAASYFFITPIIPDVILAALLSAAALALKPVASTR